MLKDVDEERLEFVRFWARYTRNTDPMVWSKQQKVLIDSVLESANQDVKMYLRTKEIAREVLARLRRTRKRGGAGGRER